MVGSDTALVPRALTSASLAALETRMDDPLLDSSVLCDLSPHTRCMTPPDMRIGISGWMPLSSSSVTKASS